MSLLQHPNLITLVDVFMSTADCFLILTHAGNTLLSHYRLVEELNIPGIVFQVLSGLERMHTHKIVHNDPKASNIFIRHNLVQLGDFGASFIYGSCNFTVPTGTVWYMSPECLLGATLFGPPADIWSMGCVLAELALRDPPFQGKDEGVVEGKLAICCP